MQDLRIANVQGIFCVDLQCGCKSVIVLISTLRGGGGRNPINTSIELVDLFTYTSGGIL